MWGKKHGLQAAVTEKSHVKKYCGKRFLCQIEFASISFTIFVSLLCTNLSIFSKLFTEILLFTVKVIVKLKMSKHDAAIDKKTQ